MGATGTQEAIAEQLRLGQELRRKVERPESGDSSGEGSSGTDSASDASDVEQLAAGASGRQHSRRAAAKIKAAALDIINGAPAYHPSACVQADFCAGTSCMHV